MTMSRPPSKNPGKLIPPNITNARDGIDQRSYQLDPRLGKKQSEMPSSIP